MGNKRIFISDVHMGAGRAKDEGYHDYDWLGKEEADNLASFLDHINSSGDVSEVILLGDIMDDWVCPVDKVPPTYEDIINADKNKKLIIILKTLSSNAAIKVIYLPGNHDMHVTKEFIENNFPGMIFGGSAKHDSKYTDGRLHAEHGSAYAMFNAPDFMNNYRNRLPLGYFISRVLATKAARTGSKDKHYWTYLDDALEALGTQSLSSSVFEAVLEEADLPNDVEIHMPPIEGQSVHVKASDVKDMYADLYDQWNKYKGPAAAFHGVIAEFHLGKVADRLSKRGNARIVIFGHSHNGALDKDSLFVKDRIYANCGSWCDKDKATYVEYTKGMKKRTLRLMSWDREKATQEDKKELER